MNDIIIARYTEELDWIVDIPNDFDVYIYNKGDAITSSKVTRRASKIMQRKNVGREAESYLWHIENSLGGGRYTIFCQGNPLEHSPDFINLLVDWRLWENIQTLSWQWRAAKNVPPAAILKNYNGKKLGISRIRSEYFSLITWNPLHFYDDGAFEISRIYRDIHNLDEGTNIGAHFYSMCGLTKLSAEAALHLVGEFSYGGIFAANNELVRAIPKENVSLLYKATHSHQIYGYVIERLWLHLFGKAFFMPEYANQETAPKYLPEAMAFVPFSDRPQSGKNPESALRGKLGALRRLIKQRL